MEKFCYGIYQLTHLYFSINLINKLTTSSTDLSVVSINIASKNSNLPIDQVKTFYAKHENRHKIEDDITNEKLFNHLKEFATIKESSKTTDQLRKEKEKNG